MIIQSILKPYLCLVLLTLTACSHSVNFQLAGETEVSKITRAELSGDLDPSNYATSIESKNSRNPDGYFAYYFATKNKVSELIEVKDMHSLIYKVVECSSPEIVIYGDLSYRLLDAPLGLEAASSEEYFAVYIPKKYPEFFQILNKNSGQRYKEIYDDLSTHCLRFNAGAMTGSNLTSNLIPLDRM